MPLHVQGRVRRHSHHQIELLFAIERAINVATLPRDTLPKVGIGCLNLHPGLIHVDHILRQDIGPAEGVVLAPKTIPLVEVDRPVSPLARRGRGLPPEAEEALRASYLGGEERSLGGVHIEEEGLNMSDGRLWMDEAVDSKPHEVLPKNLALGVVIAGGSLWQPVAELVILLDDPCAGLHRRKIIRLPQATDLWRVEENAKEEHRDN